MPCIGEEIKSLILQEYPELEKVLEGLPDCADPRAIKLKGKRSKREGGEKRQPSAYNEFVGTCFKQDSVKQLPRTERMTECAKRWKQQKK